LYPSDKNGHNVRTPFRCHCALSAFPPKRQAHSSGWHVCATKEESPDVVTFECVLRAG
jgi:hypothetical protein